MTTHGLAVLVCEATKPCPGVRGPVSSSPPACDGDACPRCRGKRTVYVLDERARKPCPGHRALLSINPWELVDLPCSRLPSCKGGCKGRGWTPAILLPEEICPSCGGTGNVEERAYPPGVATSTCSECGGSGTSQQVNEGLLIALLGTAGFLVLRVMDDDNNSPIWDISREDDVQRERGRGRSLLEAAARAMGVTA